MSESASVGQLFAGVRETLYGFTDLKPLWAGVAECRLHETVEAVLERAGVGVESSVVPGVLGKHPAILEGGDRNSSCRVPMKVLRADAAFLEAAISMSVPGFAYVREGVLPQARKWEKGAVVGMAAFGRGYCYLEYIRPGFRMRVARILGPIPSLADVAMMIRIAGVCKTDCALVRVTAGIYHCVPGGKCRSMLEVMREILHVIFSDGGARIGVEKVLCERCNFLVNPEGHADRCRVSHKMDETAAFLGDALHSLDVRLCLVKALPPGSHYTVASQRFCAATAQRQYMEDIGQGERIAGMSVHRVGTVFELQYRGLFRENYLRWLRVVAGCSALDFNAEISQLIEVPQVADERGDVGSNAGVSQLIEISRVAWEVAWDVTILLMAVCFVLGWLLR